MVEHRPGPTNLDVEFCDQLTDEALKAVAEHRPGLTSRGVAACR